MHGLPSAAAVRPPWRVLAVLAVVALLLHGLLLAGVAAGGDASTAAAPASVMRVRSLPAPLPTEPVAEAPPPPAALRPPVPAAPARPKPAPAAAVAPPSATSAAPVATVDAPALAASAPERPEPTPPALAEVASAPAGTGSATAPADATGADVAAADDEIPVYKTLFPPPLTLHYDLRRGFLSGTGTLAWRPDGERYEARLEGRVAGLNVLTQVSSGGFDDAGLAPRRYTDQRMGREVRATNFQREQGKITFSGPATEFTLLVGTQDRLSWMIQLAAVVSAEPKRLAPGGKVALYVVGARADAAVWVFRCVGEETLDTPAGPVRAVKFSREPRSPYDTQADAWLDPARHGLPVRARLGTGGGTSGDGGEALELLLRDLQMP